MRINIRVNNQRTIEVFQAREDGPLYVNTLNSKGDLEQSEIINAGDFTMMLNWYRYQKENGNTNLNF